MVIKVDDEAGLDRVLQEFGIKKSRAEKRWDKLIRDREKRAGSLPCNVPLIYVECKEEAGKSRRIELADRSLLDQMPVIDRHFMIAGD